MNSLLIKLNWQGVSFLASIDESIIHNYMFIHLQADPNDQLSFTYACHQLSYDVFLELRNVYKKLVLVGISIIKKSNTPQLKCTYPLPIWLAELNTSIQTLLMIHKDEELNRLIEVWLYAKEMLKLPRLNDPIIQNNEIDASNNIIKEDGQSLLAKTVTLPVTIGEVYLNINDINSLALGDILLFEMGNYQINLGQTTLIFEEKNQQLYFTKALQNE